VVMKLLMKNKHFIIYNNIFEIKNIFEKINKLFEIKKKKN